MVFFFVFDFYFIFNACFYPDTRTYFLALGIILFWSLSLIGSTFNSVAGTCCTTVHTKFQGIFATSCPRDRSHEIQQVELHATCRGDKISPKLVLHNYKSISSHEETCCCKKSLGHVPATSFHVCANVVILSLLHVPATRPCYVSPRCLLHKFFVPCPM